MNLLSVLLENRTQLLSYSITQFLSRPLHLELGYKLKVYFLYYI